MIVFLTSAISIGITFLYGCVGEILTEKSGHLNLGIPGIMSAGAAGGCLGISLCMKMSTSFPGVLVVLIGVLFAILFAAALGLLYSFMTVTLRVNQNVTGLTITTFGVGIAKYLMESVTDKKFLPRASAGFVNVFPFASKLGGFGQIFLSHGVLAYLAIIVALVAAYILKRTRIGLHLRAVGENPAAADAVGINVTAYKYIATCVGSAIAGLGGLFYVMDYLRGSWEYGIEAMGWLAIALVIFTVWKPDLSILGSFVFGGLYIASSYIGGLSFSEKYLFKLLPYVVTVLVLILTSVFNSKETQPPASLGLSYFREER